VGILGQGRTNHNTSAYVGHTTQFATHDLSVRVSCIRIHFRQRDHCDDSDSDDTANYFIPVEPVTSRLKKYLT
jgi:hypothetical protein